jgi:hypothetical protein
LAAESSHLFFRNIIVRCTGTLCTCSDGRSLRSAVLYFELGIQVHVLIDVCVPIYLKRLAVSRCSKKRDVVVIRITQIALFYCVFFYPNIISFRRPLSMSTLRQPSQRVQVSVPNQGFKCTFPSPKIL